MAEGGRRLYAAVPPWLCDFGDYPMLTASGRRNLLLITGYNTSSLALGGRRAATGTHISYRGVYGEKQGFTTR